MLLKRKTPKFHINPRFRAYGKARLDIARRAESRQDWDNLWKQSTFPFPFEWGEHWKQCIEYKVDDFAAEVGFFIDILGFPVNAFDPDYAMFTSPNRDFFFSVVPTPEGSRSTPPQAIRLQFMISDLLDTAEELQRRGIQFDRFPGPCRQGASLYIGEFRTPHGICVEIWGMVEPNSDEDEDGDFDINVDQVELKDFEEVNTAQPAEIMKENANQALDVEPEAVQPDNEPGVQNVGINFGLFSRRTHLEEPAGEIDTDDEQAEFETNTEPVDIETEEDPYSFLLADKDDDEEWEEDDPVDVEYVDDDY